jgi:hypothetical protein
MAFFGDNTNTNSGRINRSGSKHIFHDLKHDLKKDLVDVGFPAHILHSCIQYGADTLSVDIECIVKMIYSFFLHIYSKNRKSQELLWIRWYKLQTTIVSQQNKMYITFPAVERLLQMKMAVFWVIAPCSLVEIYQSVRGPCCLHHQGDE